MSSHLQVTPRYRQYSDQASRLRTFYTGWPNAINPKRMSTAGFFYTGAGDTVLCFVCGVGLKDWNPDDNPWYQHIKLSPLCRFPAISLPPYDFHAYKEQIKAEQTSSKEVFPFTHDGKTPSHSPNFSSVHARLSTFHGWRKISPSALKLAEAGLFYTGINDTVRCFHCNGGLRNWDDGDDPWVEHARLFPCCGFVRHIKGEKYIRSVQSAFTDDDDEGAKESELSKALQTLNLRESSKRLLAINLPAPCGLPTSRPTITDRRWIPESENPIYSKPAQSVINMGYSRAAVTMAMEECIRKDKTMSADKMVNILCEMQEKREHLPPARQITERDRFFKLHTPVPADSLVAENEMLRRQLTCCVCETNKADILFLPCGHACLCEKCSSDVTLCMFCVTPVYEKKRIYR